LCVKTFENDFISVVPSITNISDIDNYSLFVHDVSLYLANNFSLAIAGYGAAEAGMAEFVPIIGIPLLSDDPILESPPTPPSPGIFS